MALHNIFAVMMQSRHDINFTKRIKRDSSKASSFVSIDGVWQRIIARRYLAILLTVLATISLIAPLSQMTDNMAGWWVAPIHLPATVSAMALLMWGVLIGLSGQAIGLWKNQRRNLQYWANICITLGVSVLLGIWLYSSSQEPAGIISLPLQQTVESYDLPLGDHVMKRMLPSRVTLSELSFGDSPTAQLTLSGPGQDNIIGMTQLAARESLDYQGLRLAFVGLDESNRGIRALLSSTQPDSIPVRASLGQRIQLELDGPTYEVVDIAENYMDAMGPAVQLHSLEDGEFWVFAQTDAVDMNLGHDLRLERLESIPSALIAVTTSIDYTYFAGAISFLVLGIVLLLLHLIRQPKPTKNNSKSSLLVYHNLLLAVFWLLWAGALYLNWFVFGAFSMQAPAEWYALGILLILSAAILWFWSETKWQTKQNIASWFPVWSPLCVAIAIGCAALMGTYWGSVVPL